MSKEQTDKELVTGQKVICELNKITFGEQTDRKVLRKKR